ncbi:MAG: hypothetical protein GXO57_03655 [Thermodesulfobacteria bacterium]|nr:hypothetical protein [Thermodesulfobacteriota bacterium]
MGTRILKTFKFISALSIFVSLFFITGCGNPKFRYPLNKPNHEMCQGIVFDFINPTDYVGLGRIFRETLAVNLMKEGYIIKDSSIAYSFFTPEDKILYYYMPDAVFSKELVKRIGGLLNLEWIVGGKILKAVDKGDFVELETIVWVRDAKTGKLLWYSYYKRNSNSYRTIFQFGKTKDIYMLANMMINKEILEDLRGILKCSLVESSE